MCNTCNGVTNDADRLDTVETPVVNYAFDVVVVVDIVNHIIGGTPVVVRVVFFANEGILVESVVVGNVVDGFAIKKLQCWTTLCRWMASHSSSVNTKASNVLVYMFKIAILQNIFQLVASDC